MKEQTKDLQQKLAEVKGERCEVYSRVVGYHRPVENWNEGKQEEFKDRVVFNVDSAGIRD
nr:anaerobic ribonucleoside-triphosphate reductase [Calditerrivibrio nitroreducens]